MAATIKRLRGSITIFVLLHSYTGNDWLICLFLLLLYSTWVYVKCLLCTRNLFVNQMQSRRYTNALFVANPYAFATNYFSSLYGRDSHAIYPFYTLSQSTAKPQYPVSCGYRRKPADIQRKDRVCFAYALRMYCICKADVIRNQNFVQLKNPGNGKTCLCG